MDFRGFLRFNPSSVVTRRAIPPFTDLIHTLALAGESDIVKSSQEETRRLPELFTSTGKVLLSCLDGTDWKKLAENPRGGRAKQNPIRVASLHEPADNVGWRRQPQELAQLHIHNRIRHSPSGSLPAFGESVESRWKACMNQQTRLVSRLASILICLLPLQNLSMAARKVELTLPWSELERYIGPRKIALVLPDGVHVVGKVMSITPDVLVLNITKSSDPTSHPKGKASIARSAVSVIQMNETKGSKRALWSSVGAGAGLVGGWLLAEGIYMSAAKVRESGQNLQGWD